MRNSTGAGGVSRLVQRSFAVSAIVALAVALAACGGTPAGTGGPSPTIGPQASTCAPIATATPTSPAKGGCGGEPFTAGELRLFLIDELGPLWYCDRDSYPVGRDEQQAALATYPEMAADTQLFGPVAAKLGIDPAAKHTDAQKLALYRLWKVATAVSLEPIGNDRWRFDYLAQPVGGATEGTRTGGIVDSHGAITIEQQASAGEPMCPICLARGTPIDAPDGPIAVERLRIGDTIWTLDARGRRVTGTVIALGSTTAPRNHEVVHLVLADGRSVTASPGHPTAAGGRIGDLEIGDLLDGSAVVSAERLPYGDGATFDLVVSGETGLYLAGGIPLRSTLDPGRS